MATDSTIAGYLAPSEPGPAYDEALEDIFHDAIAGITGINGALVRPRWQPAPANDPQRDVAWISFGVTIMESDYNAYQQHDPDGIENGTNVQERTELLHVLISFYGPDCQATERLFRDGMQVDQNRAALRAQQIGYKEILAPVNLPALLKEKWRKRVDATLVALRYTTRVYQVRNIESAELGLDNELYITPIIVNPPP